MSKPGSAERIAYIRRQAIKHHLDPNAVLAIASHEGLSGGVGDGGHAFGPFQMNDAGGVLTNDPASHHNNQWAWSNEGINRALSGMASVAAGLHGRAAVSAIAQRYERPADPAAEISDAMAHYGSTGGGGGGASSGTVTISAGRKSRTEFDQGLFRKQAGMMLLQQAQAQAAGVQTDPNALVAQLQQAKQAATMKVSAQGGAAGQGHPVVGGHEGLGSQAVRIAGRQVGIPYVWGGESRSGFDCSGLIQYVYGKLGVKLPRVAADQGRAGHAVSYQNLKPGDLLVEGNGDHVVMYAGGNRVIEAPHTGDNVKYAPLSWFPQSQYNARRIVGR